LVLSAAIARARVPVAFVGGNCHECSDDATLVVGDRHYCDDHAAIALARSGSPAPAAPVDDVCIAGSPAIYGICGDNDCVCYDSAKSLAAHVLAMADDAYLVGHPEWLEIVADADQVARGWKITR